jgi:hypothetical protein
MRFWSLVTLFLSLTGLPLAPAAQAADAQTDLAANAALKYWQAFALLPTLDKEQEKLLVEWDTIPLDAAALKLVDSSAISRMYLHRGARLPRCDWSLDYQDGVNLYLPHLAKALTLARLAALHARHELTQGRFRAGVDDATAVLVLARKLDPDPSLISTLVRYKVEVIALDMLAPYLPQLDAAAVKRLSAQLENLPVGATIQQKLLAEKSYQLPSIIRIMQASERDKKGSWREALKAIVAEPQSKAAVDGISTFEKAIQLVEDLAPIYDQQAKLMVLPKEEYEAQYPGLVKKATAANPLAGLVLIEVDKLAAFERRHQVLIALFKAAMAVAQEGPGKLKEIKDPFGTGPFEYRALDKGFELKSKLLFHDQPVTLVAGKGKKE